MQQIHKQNVFSIEYSTQTNRSYLLSGFRLIKERVPQKGALFSLFFLKPGKNPRTKETIL